MDYELIIDGIRAMLDDDQFVPLNDLLMVNAMWSEEQCQ